MKKKFKVVQYKNLRDLEEALNDADEDGYVWYNVVNENHRTAYPEGVLVFKLKAEQ